MSMDRFSGPQFDIELQVITRRVGKEQDWGITRSMDSEAFQHVLRPLIAATPLRVVRVREASWGPGGTVEPYE